MFGHLESQHIQSVSNFRKITRRARKMAGAISKAKNVDKDFKKINCRSSPDSSRVTKYAVAARDTMQDAAATFSADSYRLALKDTTPAFSEMARASSCFSVQYEAAGAWQSRADIAPARLPVLPPIASFHGLNPIAGQLGQDQALMLLPSSTLLGSAFLLGASWAALQPVSSSVDDHLIQRMGGQGPGGIRWSS